MTPPNDSLHPRGNGWTADMLKWHYDEIAKIRSELEAKAAVAEADLREERDRRYAEVATEREKALKIKETADLAALGLAREIQTYKDEKANELRSQIERERGSYPTRIELVSAVEKIEAAIFPLNSFVVSQQGRSRGIGMSATIVVAAVTVFVGIVGLVIAAWVATH